MTTVRPYAKARSVNSTATSFAAKAPTTTEPSGDAGTAAGAAVIDLAVGGGLSPCRMVVVPYGVGAADNQFDMRVIGWKRIGATGACLWVPTILASLTCTMGTAAGVAGAPVVATELFCDTLAILSEATVTADATRTGSVTLYSPANNTVAWAEIDLQGVEKIEFTFDSTTGPPTEMNCLYSLI